MNTLLKNSNLLAKVCAIQYIPCSDVISVVRGSSDFSRVVNMATGKTWLDLYATPGSMKFSQPTAQSAAGTFYDQKLSIKFPGLDPDNLPSLFNTDATEYIVKLTMAGGDEYIMGDKKQPARLVEDFSTESSGFSLTFVCKSTQRACQYEN